MGPGFETTKNLLRRPHPHRGGVFLIPVQELLFSFVDLFDIVPGDFDVFDPGDFDIFPGVLNVFDPGDFDVFAPGDFDVLARDFDVVAGLVCS